MSAHCYADVPCIKFFYHLRKGCNIHHLKVIQILISALVHSLACLIFSTVLGK